MRVKSSRFYELYCETHGVLAASRHYEDIKRARIQHRQESLECFFMPSSSEQLRREKVSL